MNVIMLCSYFNIYMLHAHIILPSFEQENILEHSLI